MLNNEFTLIGVVISDFEQKGTEKYPKYEFKLEVEKKFKGATAVYSITVLGNNKSVDTSKSLVGRKIIARGYVDSYKDFINLVLQDFEDCGSGGSCSDIEAALQETPVVSEKEYSEFAEANGNLDEDIDLPDDDLPF